MPNVEAIVPKCNIAEAAKITFLFMIKTLIKIKRILKRYYLTTKNIYA